MIDIKDKEIEKAILVGVRTNDISKERVEEHLDELEMLTETAGAETVFKIVQDRNKVDKAYFIGKGKAEEIAELAEMNEIKLIIFDDDLTPSQARNLEKLFDKKILDRSGLILDIFAKHAKTNEAKTQVELAQLQYMLPRLTRAWTHLSKQHGGIGTKGPGETQIETDRRLIRTRISKLKEKLGKIESQFKTKSQQRKNFVTASLVGYTNAGKSTLLNFLTDAGVLAENKLFATLDSTTRSFELSKNRNVMLSDTVGFIRKLPHHLVASFKSTLNVVKDADIILHLIDITHPFFEDHMQVIDETLKDLQCDEKTKLIVFNKVDALEDKEKIEYVKNKYPGSILISAARGINTSELKDKLEEIYEENIIEKEIKFHVKDSRFINQIHGLATVINTKYEDEFVIIKYNASKAINNKIQSMIYEKENISS